MNDKELIKSVRELMYEQSEGMWSINDIEAKQFISLCQPQWIMLDDKLPDELPHRNVVIAYQDAVGKVFSGSISSRMVRVTNCFAWHEEEPLPEPPEEDK